MDDLTEGPQCGVVDAEPNNAESGAVRLPSTNDCDGSGSSGEGVLAGSRDADWFYYEGYDVGYCRVNPTIELDAETDVRACTFFDCVEGTAEVSCPKGTTKEQTEDGLLGCCGTGYFKVGGLNCVGTGYDAADVYIRIDSTRAHERCSDYSFDYHF